MITDYINAGYDPTTVMSPWSVMGNVATLVLDTSDSQLPIDSMSSAVFQISMVVIQGANPHNLVDHAEISYSRDELGLTGADDVDSTPDTDPTNEPGADANSPDTAADGFVDGDGTGGIDDGVAATDEDDADPAEVPVFDLALTKTVDPGSVPADGTFNSGDTIIFLVNVINQGNVDGTDIIISDIVPCGMEVFDETIPTNDLAGWSSLDADTTRTTVDFLAAGTTVQIPIAMVVEVPAVACPSTTLDPYANYAYVESAEDDMGMSVADIDSDPCLLYTSPSPRDLSTSRMPSSA